MEPDRENNMGKQISVHGAKGRRILWLVGVAVLVLAVVGTISYLRLSQPTYQGKTAEEWFNQIDPIGKPWKDDPAVQALLAMGETAVSFLMQQFTHCQSHVLEFCMPWIDGSQSAIGEYVVSSQQKLLDRSYTAYEVLELLGPKANSAVPQLMRVADGSNMAIKGGAMRLLGYVQTDPESTTRFLLQHFDQDQDFALAAALGLSAIGPKAKAAAPILLQKLQDPKTQKPMAMIPVVVALLGIEESVDLAVSAGRQILSSTPPTDYVFLLHGLKELGPKAKPALPLLLELSQHQDPQVRRLATNALKRIDPEAAAKVYQ